MFPLPVAKMPNCAQLPNLMSKISTSTACWRRYVIAVTVSLGAPLAMTFLVMLFPQMDFTKNINRRLLVLILVVLWKNRCGNFEYMYISPVMCCKVLPCRRFAKIQTELIEIVSSQVHGARVKRAVLSPVRPQRVRPNSLRTRSKVYFNSV